MVGSLSIIIEVVVELRFKLLPAAVDCQSLSVTASLSLSLFSSIFLSSCVSVGIERCADWINRRFVLEASLMISECDRVVTSRKKELLSLEPRPSATSIFSLLFSPLLSTTTDYPDYYSSTHLASAMSWQGYVDTNLVGTGKVSKAAIIGLKGGVWATSQGFTVSNQS